MPFLGLKLNEIDELKARLNEILVREDAVSAETLHEDIKALAFAVLLCLDANDPGLAEYVARISGHHIIDHQRNRCMVCLMSVSEINAAPRNRKCPL
jgi:uncharacterized protein with PIN domain